MNDQAFLEGMYNAMWTGFQGDDDVAVDQIDEGLWPQWLLRDGEPHSYAVKVFVTTGIHMVLLDDKETYLEELESREMPTGLPSDGSKGQWRTWNRLQIKTARYFCE